MELLLKYYHGNTQSLEAVRQYLECGIHAHGFARARCGGGGHVVGGYSIEDSFLEPDYIDELPWLASIVSRAFTA